MSMSALPTVLLHLYPRAWRQRYGTEMRDLLAEQGLSLRTAVDLIAGAIDARFNPQAPVRTTEGGHMMTKVFRCSPANVSRQDHLRSAAWMIGGSLIFVLTSMALQQQFGRSALSEGLLYAAFPGSFMLSMECTYLKPYSRQVRIIMSIGGAILIVLMMWASVAIGNRI